MKSNEVNDRKKKESPFQQVYEKFKHHLKPDFELKHVFEIYLPFWLCTQRIIVEKELAPDRFSEIIMRLIQNGVDQHSALCGFLGIHIDSFTTSQLHFLLKNGLLAEKSIADDVQYSVTPEGTSFISKKSNLKNLEPLEFEFYYNDVCAQMMDPRQPLDASNMSEGQKKSFSGYRFLETRRLPDGEVKVTHENKPYKINSVEFSSFFNSLQKEDSFYDFDAGSPEAHKRSICFLALEYVDPANSKRYEIRHSKKSVVGFSGYQLEEELSKRVTEHFNKNPLTNYG